MMFGGIGMMVKCVCGSVMYLFSWLLVCLEIYVVCDSSFCGVLV